MARSTTEDSRPPDDLWEAVYRSLRLSRRQRQLVELLLEDLKNAAIARRLGLKTSTVASYLERLYRKVGVQNRVTLVARVYEEKLAILVGHFPICAKCKARNGSAPIVQLKVSVRKSPVARRKSR